MIVVVVVLEIVFIWLRVTSVFFSILSKTSISEGLMSPEFCLEIKGHLTGVDSTVPSNVGAGTGAELSFKAAITDVLFRSSCKRAANLDNLAIVVLM